VNAPTAVSTEVHDGGGMLEVVIAVPKGNVLTQAVMREIDRALETHAPSPPLRMVLIRAEGKHFSFGASIEEHRREQVREMLSTFHALVRRVARFPVPVVAMVQGKCLGGAFELALACHLVLATDDAVFSCPEIKLGVIPPVLAALGPSRLGACVAERLLYTGGDLDAHAALAAGFAAQVVPRDANLANVWTEYYRTHFAPLSAHAIRHAVRAVRSGNAFDNAVDAGLTAAEERYLAHIVPSHDGNEGIEAFLSKRAPVWSHA